MSVVHQKSSAYLLFNLFIQQWFCTIFEFYLKPFALQMKCIHGTVTYNVRLYHTVISAFDKLNRKNTHKYAHTRTHFETYLEIIRMIL